MKNISYGYTDTPVEGVSSLTFPRAVLNFAADWDVAIDRATELIVTNLTAPRAKPENIRLSWQKVTDMYSNVDIAPANQVANLSGTAILIQLTEIGTITDSTDAAYEKQVPLSLHIVMRIPATDLVTDDYVLTALGRLVSACFETGSVSSTRIKKILRGALKPADL